MNKEYELIVPDTAKLISKLERMYHYKCGQIEKSNTSVSSLRCQVLKAEADVIKAELDAYLGN